MQDHRAGDADADGKDGPSAPVRKNPEGGDRQAASSASLRTAVVIVTYSRISLMRAMISATALSARQNGSRSSVVMRLPSTRSASAARIAA